MKETKLERHVRLAKKHIKKIEDMGYDVAVSHMELNVYDYSSAPPVNERGKHFDPSDYVIAEIA